MKKKTAAITQLEAIPEFDLLLSLADGNVHVHSLSTFAYISTIDKTKGTLHFTTDVQIRGQIDMDTHRRSAQRAALKTMNKSELSLRLCCVMKKKMSTFQYVGSQFVLKKELATPDVCRSTVWAGKHIIAAYKREYDLVDVETGRVEQLETDGKGCGDPLITRLPFNVFAALIEEDKNKYNTIYKTIDGRPATSYAVEWTSRPRTIETYEPFIVALTDRGVEVRFDDSTSKLVQTIPHSKVPFMVYGKHFLIASQNACWLLVPTRFETLISDMKTRGMFVDAKKIAKRINETEEENILRLRKIQNDHAYYEYSKKNFEGALKLLEADEYPPMNVLLLYNWLMPNLKSSTNESIPVLDLTEDEENVAIRALSSYLTEKRRQLLQKMKKELTNDEEVQCKRLMKIVDTTQLRCYIRTAKQLIGPFMRIKNSCDLVESEKMLKAANMEKELIELYSRRNMHAKALEILRNEITRAADTATLNTAMHKMVIYLQKLGREDTDVIVKYADSVLSRDENLGMTIFISEDFLNVMEFDREKVMSYLKTYPHLLVKYLEYVIYKWGETSPRLRTELALAYCHTVTNNQTPQNEKDEIHKKLHKVLKDSTSATLDASSIIRVLASQPGLYHEKAILFGLLQRHDDALELITTQIRDYTIAEEYCLAHFDKNKVETENLFMDLLRNYLEPKSGSVDMGSALKILRKHADKLDPEKALNLLPNVTKVKDIQEFLIAILKQREETRHALAIKRHLVKTEQLQISKQKIAIHKISFTFNENTTCGVCRRPLRIHAFAIFPCGIHIHLHCMNQDGSCPVHSNEGRCRLNLSHHRD